MHHVLKLLASDLEPFWSQSLNACTDQRACCLDVVCNLVLDRMFTAARLHNHSELREGS